jgi:hypothetical protein
MINTLIHFYRKGKLPFRSLSELTDQIAEQRMQDLYVEGAIIWERFKEPAAYLQARRQTERWLHEEFTARGGAPPEPYPIYLMLGKSRWLEEMDNEVIRATTAEIHVPLSLFNECEISFTYPDSMVSFWLAQEKDPACYLPEYHGKVFTLAEISAIVEANGLPGDGWGNNLPPHLANYIEAQVWNHRVLLEFEQNRT